jgi:RHS repeat-associated protein
MLWPVHRIPYGSGCFGSQPYEYASGVQVPLCLYASGVFTGRRFDFETGLYYYRARYYNPYIGRFLQTDPVGYGYAYCSNNPLAYVDPYGLRDEGSDDPPSSEPPPLTGFTFYIHEVRSRIEVEYWLNYYGFIACYHDLTKILGEWPIELYPDQVYTP